MSYYLKLKAQILMLANPSPEFNCIITFFLSFIFLVIGAFWKPFWLFKGLVAKFDIPQTCFWALLINIDNFTLEYLSLKLMKSTIPGACLPACWKF